MFDRRTGYLMLGCALAATACASAGDDDSTVAIPVPGENASQNEPAAPPVEGSTTPAGSSGDGGTPATSGSTPVGPVDSAAPTAADESTTVPNGTVAPDSTNSTTSTTAAPASTTTSTTSTTTTTTVPELDVFDPLCVVEVELGDSIGLIADEFDDPTVNIATIIAENQLDDDVIYAGQFLDVCVDNGLDDITGAERTAPNGAVVVAGQIEAIKAQQLKLNELFGGTGMRDLLVDGVSGPVTQQRLCAARVALGLPVTRDDMAIGSEEEAQLMATEELRQPFTTALLSERWILIDRTCQIMFAGEGDNGITFVFPTSTGEAGFETRTQDRSRAFRFDPALDNEGWHNSTDYPVPVDNPLNGNMYKPLYFDGGQAIHGANNVPTTPQSKGCARLHVADQDALLGWLGLADADGPTNSSDRINVTVNVQGTYLEPPAPDEEPVDEPVDA